MNKTIAISGGFDPIHAGHIELIGQAAAYGDVIIILNSDEWLIRKKGFCFYPFEERVQILRNIKKVRGVCVADDKDDTVCETLARLKPDYFANGGDRKPDNTPELKLCADLGIKPLFGIGGDKANSSSAIAKRNIVQREWGSYQVIHENLNYKVKCLDILPGKATSEQLHDHRRENWIAVDSSVRAVMVNCEHVLNRLGDSLFIPANMPHQLKNVGTRVARVIEVQTGDYLGEDDITRL